jgi:hypothetical protein
MEKCFALYHNSFGNGIIISSYEDHYKIDFGTCIRYIKFGSWRKVLFLTKEEADGGTNDKNSLLYNELSALEEKISHEETYTFYVSHNETKINLVVVNIKYEFLINHPEYKVSLNDGVITIISEEEAREVIQRKILNEVHEKVVLHNEEVTDFERCIAIISVSKVCIKKETYLRIIGIDAISAKLVTIVDTNGMKYNLHSYTLSFMNMNGKMTTIKARYRLINDNITFNILKIVSKFDIIGDQPIRNIIELSKKYKYLFNKSIITEYSQIKRFSYHFVDRQICFLMNFSKSQIRKYKENYQINMQGDYFNIYDDACNIKEKENLYFRGLALVSWTSYNGKPRYHVIKLLGNYYNEEKINRIKKINEGTDLSDETPYTAINQDYEEYNQQEYFENEFDDAEMDYLDDYPDDEYYYDEDTDSYIPNEFYTEEYDERDEQKDMEQRLPDN